RSYGVGCVHTGVYPKRNSRCTWVSSSSYTTCASGGKRYWVRSLSCWSHKTLESNKSVVKMPSHEACPADRCLVHRLDRPRISLERLLVAHFQQASLGHRGRITTVGLDRRIESHIGVRSLGAGHIGSHQMTKHPHGCCKRFRGGRLLFGAHGEECRTQGCMNPV